MSQSPRYLLVVRGGSYEADTVFGLLYEVLSHRFSHLAQGDGWVD